MFKKKLTFMVVPSSTEGSAKQVQLSLGSIYLAVGIMLTLIIGSFILSSLFFSNQVDQAELADLKAENEQLTQKYEEMRWNLSEVETRYAALVDKEVKIRTLFDLPEISTDERQLGIGGPAPLNLDVLTPSEQFAVQTESEIDHLIRLSRFETEKYEEVEESLLKIKDRLEHTPSIWPSKGWNSRGYGMKHDPFTGYKRMHRGIDLANKTGTPIIATADGTIARAGTNGDMGKFVAINHGYGFKTNYGHLSKVMVKRGQKVKRGDVIGLMGSTGYSTGPHLHYEVIRNGKYLNPMKYILNNK